MRTTIKVFGDLFDCPNAASAARFVSFYEVLQRFKFAFTCKRCRRAVALPKDQCDALPPTTTMFQANEKDGIDPKSKDADWWIYFYERLGWPFTGWACGRCSRELMEGQD